MDLKDERHAKLELQATVSQLELEVKKLKADLHVSCNAPDEAHHPINLSRDICTW